MNHPMLCAETSIKYLKAMGHTPLQERVVPPRWFFLANCQTAAEQTLFDNIVGAVRERLHIDCITNLAALPSEHDSVFSFGVDSERQCHQHTVLEPISYYLNEPRHKAALWQQLCQLQQTH